MDIIDINEFVEDILFQLRRESCSTGDPSEVNAYGKAISIIQKKFDELFPAPVDVEEVEDGRH